MTRAITGRVGRSRGRLGAGIRLVYDRRREERTPVPSDLKSTWPDDARDVRPTREQLLAEERLAFTDRIIGLEEQVKELRRESISGPSEAVAVESNLAALQSSTTWKVGRVVMLPMRALRVIKRRVLR
ncbi:hypothetical protein [Agromyces agglutinans]|uniref:hypothetical protein n=1 Tax=Agromyces agglutinans TaxID=2662258 RepID=UPI001562E15B|nr:hypothetical protein [Agromyces agglutinans]